MEGEFREGGSVFVSVCGRVQRIDIPEASLEGLCAVVAARFDLGGVLRFVADEEGEPEVQTDEQLERYILERRTLRVLIGDGTLSELEQRMWQLRQLQWGFFQDEVSRTSNSQLALRSETRQLRQALEQSARREVELTGELMSERRAREKAEAAALERHDNLVAELRREARAREASEAALKKEIEDCRQSALKYAAASERQTAELKNALVEESRSRGKNIEALLSEWAASQAEIRTALDTLRLEAEKNAQDVETQAKGLVREAAAREAFEQFFGEKLRGAELSIGRIEGTASQLDKRLEAAKDEAADATRAEAAERVAGDQELQWVVCELRDEARKQAEGRILSPVASHFGEVPIEVMKPASQLSTSSTVSVTPSTRIAFPQVAVVTGSAQQRSPSAGPLGRSTTPPPFGPGQQPAQPAQVVRRSGAYIQPARARPWPA